MITLKQLTYPLGFVSSLLLSFMFGWFWLFTAYRTAHYVATSASHYLLLVLVYLLVTVYVTASLVFVPRYFYAKTREVWREKAA